MASSAREPYLSPMRRGEKRSADALDAESPGLRQIRKKGSRGSIISISSSSSDELWAGLSEPNEMDLEEAGVVEDMIGGSVATSSTCVTGRVFAPADSMSDFSVGSSSTSAYITRAGRQQSSSSSSLNLGYPTPKAHRIASFSVPDIPPPAPIDVPDIFRDNETSGTPQRRQETTYGSAFRNTEPVDRPPSPESPSAKRHRDRSPNKQTPRVDREVSPTSPRARHSPPAPVDPIARPLFQSPQVLLGSCQRPSTPPRSGSSPPTETEDPWLPPPIRHLPLASPQAHRQKPPPSPAAATSAAPLPRLIKEGPLDVPVEIIAHSRHAQRDMDMRRISWGVQYNLARGVSCGLWSWGDITPSVLNNLKGSNAEAVARIPEVMKSLIKGEENPFAVLFLQNFIGPLSTYQEYDREEEALREGGGRGLGLQGEWKGEAEWYGGRIQQVASVEFDKSTDKLILRLEQPDMRRSNRFARFLGSRRVLELKLHKKFRFDDDNRTIDLLSKKFVLCGRMYVPIDSKDGKVYLMETNENYERSSSAGDDDRMSFWDFVEWHNPLSLNSQQPISKWSTRFDLGLSTSIPILQFEPQNIAFIRDQEAEHDLPKAPAEKVMTDGCGFINGAALIMIAQRLNLVDMPTAVQGRIAGSKGLWILHPQQTASTDPPRIWIRDSQQKIRLSDLTIVDRSHLIFDLCTPSTVTTPARLSMQLILNLSHNGVPSAVFKELLKEGLQEEVGPLMAWRGPTAMPLLWHAVNRAGNVTGTKIKRMAGGIGRALGLVRRLDGKDELPSDDDLLDVDAEDLDLSLFVQSEGSAAPASLHQAVLELIQAGFNPGSFWPLYEKLRQVVRNSMDAYITKYSLPVQYSAEAFIIPDPMNVLEEGEVYFRSSRDLKDPANGLVCRSITGPVLVSRNPARVASDVQKVVAVEHPLLARYVDVIVFSVKGSRSLASYLGGGDYDGDTAMINWSPLVVQKFRQPTFVDKPQDLEEDNFEKHVEHVVAFHGRLSSLPPEQSHPEFVKILLRGLADKKVGLYSTFHDNAVYAFGYDHPRTVRLAYMFTTCLDSSKTGLKVLKKVFASDRSQYDRPKCQSMKPDMDDRGSDRNLGALPRDKGLPSFVLDSLRAYGKDLSVQYLVTFETLRGTLDACDPDLIAPYRKLEKMINDANEKAINDAKEKRDPVGLILEAELECVRAHVHATKLKFGKATANSSGTRKGIPGTPHKSRPSPTKRSNSGSGEAADEGMTFKKVECAFAAGPPPEQVPWLTALGSLPALRASYAYYHAAHPHKGSEARFPLSVAFGDLCKLKAEAGGAGAAFVRQFSDVMTMSASAVRMFNSLPNGNTEK